MNASSGNVIDLQEYRRRRQAEPVAAQQGFCWVPVAFVVWWVPVTMAVGVGASA